MNQCVCDRGYTGPYCETGKDGYIRNSLQQSLTKSFVVLNILPKTNVGIKVLDFWALFKLYLEN